MRKCASVWNLRAALSRKVLDFHYSLPRSNGTAKIISGFPIRNFIALRFLNILWVATVNTNIIFKKSKRNHKN